MEVKVRDFMFELNDEVRLPDNVINDAVSKLGANGISFREEVKALVDGGMLGLLDIDSRLHGPIANYFQDISSSSNSGSGNRRDNKSSDDEGNNGGGGDGVSSGTSLGNPADRVEEEEELDLESGPQYGNGGEAKSRQQPDSDRDQKKRVSRKNAEDIADKKRKTDLCVICGKPAEMAVDLVACAHKACAACLHDTVVRATKSKIGLPIMCKLCKKETATSALQSCLYPHEFEAYNNALLHAYIKSDEKMLVCVNERCQNVIEIIHDENLKAPDKIQEVDPRGNALSKESWLHYKKYRIRCKECAQIFCAECKESPYHMGFTCEAWVEYKNSKQCRYCATQITAKNEHKLPALSQMQSFGIPDLKKFLQTHGFSKSQISKMKEKRFLVREATTAHNNYSRVFGDICGEEECQEKLEFACPTILPCGCPCGGVKGERSHLKCLKHTPELDPEEFCPICYVESLKDAPCIQSQGKCKHIFHIKCVIGRINAGYNGARINFKFITCPLCSNEISHPQLSKSLEKWQRLRKKIETKALDRLKYEKRLADPKIQSTYGGDPVAFAMHEYLFYKCHKCKQPYFAGNYACQAADDGKFDPAELICAGCQPSQDVSSCDKHGKEWITFKCRFCCNTAQWYCWNNTHFCGKCHKPRVWQTLVNYRKGTNKKKIWEYEQCPGLKSQIEKIKNDGSMNEKQKMEAFKKLRADPRTCPLKRRHPPNGFEFGLGCTMCADKHIEADNKAAEEKAKAEKAQKKNNRRRR